MITLDISYAKMNCENEINVQVKSFKEASCLVDYMTEVLTIRISEK